jgi:colicin import membrane protein
MIAAAHAQPPVDSVKALVLAVAVHLVALLMLTLNFNWSSSVAPSPANVIKAVVVTEVPAKRQAAPPAPPKEDDSAKRKQEEARRQADALRKKKAAEKKAAEKKAEIARQQAAERKRKAAAEARHQQAQKLLQQQLAAEEFMARIGNRISSKWRRPPGSPKDAFAVVRVRVTATGRILSVQVVRSSGDPLFDRSIENAVYLAEPLPMPTDPDVAELLREFNIDTEKL